jgi:cephalosporin hydroxylase
MRDWMAEIHADNPYKDFPVEEFPMDLQGWGFESPIFEHVIMKYHPSTMIEVGSWKGASANRIAALMKSILPSSDSQLVCVDTWLGSVEHWIHRNESTMYPALNPKWGRPQIYEQFLANAIHTGNQDIIIPFPVSSIVAANFFFAKGMRADAIYIDAGHQYESVIADLEAYWKVLRPGGVIFGDDYILGWIGVVRAVHDFAERQHCSVDTSFHHKFLIEKTQ